MYHFIINPNSQSGKGLKIWRNIQRKLNIRKIAYNYTLTEYVGHATKIASSLSLDHVPVTMVVIGGDGTINEVLSGIDDSANTILGYIPTGSGNDFAKGMGLPLNTANALDLILGEHDYKELDLCHIQSNGRKNRFGVSAGIGFDASICHEALSSPLKKILNRLKLGKLTYLILALKQLIIYSPSPITVVIDGKRQECFDKVYFAAIMNQKCEGGGLRLCPYASPGDGVLDICLVEGVSKRKFLLVLPLALFAKHTHVHGVHFYHGNHFQIHSEIPLAVHRDGESEGYQKNLTVCLENRTLKVISPMI